MTPPEIVRTENNGLNSRASCLMCLSVFTEHLPNGSRNWMQETTSRIRPPTIRGSGADRIVGAIERAGVGTVKVTDLRIYSASWTLPKLLILRSSGDRFRPQNPRILLNLTVPVLGGRSLLSEHNLWSLQYRVLETDQLYLQGVHL